MCSANKKHEKLRWAGWLVGVFFLFVGYRRTVPLASVIVWPFRWVVPAFERLVTLQSPVTSHAHPSSIAMMACAGVRAAAAVRRRESVALAVGCGHIIAAAIRCGRVTGTVSRCGRSCPAVRSVRRRCGCCAILRVLGRVTVRLLRRLLRIRCRPFAERQGDAGAVDRGDPAELRGFRFSGRLCATGKRSE